jgi:hypothetical protein
MPTYPSTKAVHIVQGLVAPLLRIVTATFIRPDDVIAYVPLDVVRSPDASYYGSELNFAPNDSDDRVSGKVTSVRLLTVGPAGKFRVLLYTASQTIPADNEQWTLPILSHANDLVGSVDLDVTNTGGSNGVVWGQNFDLKIPFITVSNSLWAFVVSLQSPTYTPTGEQPFWIQISAECSR